MFCGTGSLSRVDDHSSAHQMTNRRSKKKRSDDNGRNSNPYSTRGLDKFSAVLAELQSRREKIMAKAGNPQGAATVRFMYSDSHDWIPVVLGLHKKSPKRDHCSLMSSQLRPESVKGSEVDVKMINVESFSRKSRTRRRMPGYYCPAVMVVMLLGLVMFGRMFAICSTSIWWYLVPIMKGESGRRPMVSKDHGRKSGNLA